ncbi:MAG: hypothetical protein L3K03_09455, partial [Thermoplasmata archaeon]|nr:hypothetical protein [Thermoplasmata archaeon]
MEFDTYTVAFLETGSGGPPLTELELTAMQDAHMHRLATLHDQGQLEVAGPIVTPPQRMLRGISIHKVPPEQTQALLDDDPYVRAGQLTVRVFTWLVPKGTISYPPWSLP